MVHEDDKEKVLEQSERAQNGEVVEPLEHRIIHRDGSVRWVKNSIVLQKGENGEVLSYDLSIFSTKFLYDIPPKAKSPCSL